MALGIVYMLITASVLLGIAVLLLIGGETKFKKIYLGCQMSVLFWCGSQITNLLARQITELRISYLLGNVGICLVGSLWLLFCIGYRYNKIPFAIVIFTSLVSVFHLVMSSTNSLHHLYYIKFQMQEITHGICFYTNVVYTYGCVVIGAVLLFFSVGDKTDSEHSRSTWVARILIVLSVLVPTLLNGLYLIGLFGSRVDVTPLGFGVSSILVLCATMKYRFLDVELKETTRQLALSREKLALSNERNRIAQQVHDTTGHSLTMIQSLLKLAMVSFEKKEEKSGMEYLAQARELCSSGIRELRESINQLRKEQEAELITQGIMQLANQVKEIEVLVTVQGEDQEKYSKYYRVIYDTFRETITNCLKYANATKMEVVLRFRETSIELIVADDGDGCESIDANNGLRGIQERVQGAGGTVRFVSEIGGGFMTRVKIPISE